jgi:glycosyltransferase involved in cell wall biosynthesis
MGYDQRILFVGQTGELGGAELVLLDMAHHFRDRCDVVLLSDGPLRHRLARIGVAVRVIHARSVFLRVRRQDSVAHNFAAIPALLFLVARLAVIGRRYDVLYPNSQKAAVVAMLAGLLARRPVIWHLHDILSTDHFSNLHVRTVVVLANHLARRVIANSVATRDAFIRCGGDVRRVAVVLNGVDPAWFESIPDAETCRLRDALNVPDNPLVGLFGRLSPWKGQRTLIDALPYLPDVHAIIVGEALFGEADYKAGLIRRAEEVGVADRIHWLGFRDDVPLLMRAVDIVLHTSTSPEPFGRVVVEAMLARRPFVAANHGGVVELVGENSPELIRPGDPHALAEAITRVLATPRQTRDGRAAQNEQRVRLLFSTARMMEELESELALATAPSPGPRAPAKARGRTL